MTTTSSPPRLLLLGWAGADWRLVRPLLDQGKMPHLAALIERGMMGKLVSQPPMLPPALWATLATGVLADHHDILSFAAIHPDGEVPLPLDARQLASRPLWDLVTAAGGQAAAVCWPVSHPATAFDSVVISDAFPDSRALDFASWPLQEDSVSDPQLREVMTDLRLHLNDLTPEQVVPFVPRAAQIDQETDERLPLLMATLAQAASTHAAATWLAEHRPDGLLAVHFNFLERLTNEFLQYRAPRQPHVTQTDFEIYRYVVDAAYLFLDMLLGRYLELIDEDTHVMIVSDHGYKNEHVQRLRPGAARAMQNFSKLGVLVCAGPGIKRDELVFGASLCDIAPTALHLLGLRVPDGLDGQVLQRIFLSPREPESSDISLARRLPQVAVGEDYLDWASQRLQEWVALGYMPPLATDPELAAEQCTVARQQNLASIKRQRRQFNEALEAYEAVLEIAPEHVHARMGMAQCHHALRNAEGCRAVLEDLVQSGIRDPMLDLLFGQLSLLEGDSEQAQAYLQQAQAAGMEGRLLQEMVGRAYLAAENWSAAEQSFRNALDIDPDFADAHSGLGLALHKRGEHDAAAEHFMLSLGLLYAQPATHYHLGVTLAASGLLAQASQAVENALALQPEFPAAQAALRKVERASINAMMADMEARTGQKTD